MIVTTLFKEIQEPIIVSKKVGLVISNADLDWQSDIIEEVTEEIHQRLHSEKRFNDSSIKRYNLLEITKSTYFEGIFKLNHESEISIINEIAKKVVCIYLSDFEKTFLIHKNKNIDNPTWEKTFEEKFLAFNNFLDQNKSCRDKKTNLIHTGYNTGIAYRERCRILSHMMLSDLRKFDDRYSFRSHIIEVNHKLDSIIKLGKLIDYYIKDRSDFFIIDYIIEAISEEQHNSFGVLKMFTLIEMLIVNESNYLHRELKMKLPQFISNHIIDKELWSSKVYKIRNKIAHGDFSGLEKELISYKNYFMLDYQFDFTEYSLINWIIIDIYFQLSECVSNIIWKMLVNKESIVRLKKS